MAMASFSRPALADAVDDAVAKAHAAANAGDWANAAGQYEGAINLLPGRSALLEYNLGTAYAELGLLGYASFYLRRSLQSEVDAGPVVADSARRNLGIVRRRAEIEAAAGQRRISPVEDWRDLATRGLRSRAVGWLVLAFAWLAVGCFALTRRLAPAEQRSVARFAALVLAGVAGLGAVAHGLAVGGDYGSAQGTVLPSEVQVRDGPGLHRRSPFRLQGGSQVRIVDEGAGWIRIRVRGGLEGWVERGTVAALAAERRPRLPPPQL